MIIKTLTLDNFRVFSGRHVIDLTPQANAPVILFGGLNGAGKTSILTAIRLVLLGRLAFERNISPISNKTYIAQLTEMIHRSYGPKSDKAQPLHAMVELTFEYIRDGKQTEYRITRSWSNGQPDKLIINQDGQDMAELNYEQAQAFLLELVPPGIADLVFFDGEKIAELAEDNSGQILKQAVKRLLGLDTVLRLKEDLRIYIKKAGIAAAESQLKAEFEKLEAEKTEHLMAGRLLRQEADHFAREITEKNQQIQQAEQHLLSGGGAWASDREAQKQQVDELITAKADTELEILKQLDGAYALSLAPNTLKRLGEQLQQAEAYRAKQHFASEFAEFLPQLTQRLGGALKHSTLDSTERDSTDTLKLIESEVADFAASAAKPAVEFGVSAQQMSLLTIQLAQQGTAAKQVSKLKDTLTAQELQISQSSTNIARAPEKEQLQRAFEKLRGFEEQKRTAVKHYHDKLQAAKSSFGQAQRIAQRLAKLHSDLRRAFGDNDAAARANATINLLAQFSDELTVARMAELEKAFIGAYQKLARKDDLHLTARIDAHSFEVLLIDEQGNTVNKKQLSAGEKQIYAIAMLDALGIVSGKKLPVVIDTPLGRLDSRHRDKLVKHYFPNASEQVIILSTDTEVDEQFFAELADSIAHSYEITFDHTTHSSKVTEGYFWRQKQQKQQQQITETQ